MPGVGLVQPTGDGLFQQLLPFTEVDVVAPLIVRAPKVRRDTETIARRATMATPAIKRRGAVTVTAPPKSHLAQFDAAEYRQDWRDLAPGKRMPVTSPAPFV